MDRRSCLLAPALLLAPGFGRAALAAAPPGYADVRRWGARGDGRQDDSPAFQQALDRAGQVWVPPGRYAVGDLALWSHTRLRGAGVESVLVHRGGSAILASAQARNNGSPEPRDNVHDIILEDLAFHGRCETEGFVEQNHLLVVSACSRLTVRNCHFRAFQGDAIYVGSGYGEDPVRHNEDIAVHGCTFDGVNFMNRQGVSVVDGTRVTIERNLFRDCSRHDMPGAIDIEPEAAHHRVRDIRILRNRLVGVMGGVGAICVILAVDRYDDPPRHIEIRGNRVEGRSRSLGIVAKAFVDGAAAAPLDLVVAGNEILDTFHGFEFSGVRGVRFEANRVRGTIVSPVLSVPHRGRAADVALRGNRFERVGMHSGSALKVHPTANLVIERNRFVECGWIDGSPGPVVDLSRQPPEEVRMSGNVVVEPRRPRGD